MQEPKGKTILLVEDEPIIAMMETAFLRDEGYEVVHAGNGEEAVETALAADRRFDLILMDIDLGRGIDGAEAARRILARIDLPLVFLSSHTEREVVEKTEEISSYGYIVKNSGEIVLSASIKMALKLYESNRKLKNAKTHIEAIFESTDDFIWTVDPDKFGLLSFNRGLSAYFLGTRGLGIEQGMGPRDLFPTVDFALIWEGMYREVILKGSLHREYRTYSGTTVLDLTIYPVIVNGRIEALSVFGKDITEQKRLFETLEKSEELLSSVYQASPNAVSITSLAEGRIIDFNDSYTRVFGYERAEAIGKTTKEIGLWKDNGTRERLASIPIEHGRNRMEKVELFDKAGRPVRGIVSISKVEVKGECLIIGIFTDFRGHDEAWEKW